MEETIMYNIPEELKYAKSHEWVKDEGGLVWIADRKGDGFVIKK